MSSASVATRVLNIEKTRSLAFHVKYLTKCFRLPKIPYAEFMKCESFYVFLKTMLDERKLNVYVVNDCEETLLQWLCRFCVDDEFVDIVRLVVCDYGADVNYSHPRDGNNPLMTLVMRARNHFAGAIEVALELIKRGTHLQHRNNNHENVSNLICSYSRMYPADRLYSFAKTVLDKFDIDINNVDALGRNNLLSLLERKDACSSPEIWSTILLLLSNGFNVKLFLEKIMWLVCGQEKPNLNQIIFFLHILVPMKVKLNHANEASWLDIKIPYSGNVLLYMLDAHGRNVCGNTLTPLEEELWYEIIEIFLNNGYHVNSTSRGTNETVLMMFCAYYRGKNFMDILLLLLERGADVNAYSIGSTDVISGYEKRTNTSIRRLLKRRWYVLDYFLINECQQHHFLEVYELLHRGRKIVTADDVDFERSLVLSHFNFKHDESNTVRYLVHRQRGIGKRKMRRLAVFLKKTFEETTEETNYFHGNFQEESNNASARIAIESPVGRNECLNTLEIAVFSIAFLFQAAVNYVVADFFLDNLTSRSSELLDSECHATYHAVMKVIAFDEHFIGVRAILNKNMEYHLPAARFHLSDISIKTHCIEHMKWPVFCHDKFNQFLDTVEFPNGIVAAFFEREALRCWYAITRIATKINHNTRHRVETKEI